MKKNFNSRDTEKLKKSAVVFTGFLILLLIAGSSIAMADTELLEQKGSSDAQKSVVNQALSSPKPEIAPVNPEFVEYQKSKSVIHIEEGRISGVIPSPLDLSHLRPVSAAKASAPAYYDLRTLNKVTSVKNQGRAGSCAAHATYASLESYLKPGEQWDFSENNLKNLLSSGYSEGFDRDANTDGINEFMATAYLARWTGPVDESDDPYSDSSSYSPTGLPVQKHVQNLICLSNRNDPLDNEEIKWAVQNYGAVYTTYFHDSAPEYYSPGNYSYYYDGNQILNHAVAIVGWDDSFSKNKFKKIPPGNGAFIIKNSWGTGWGDKGYFYISYYDHTLGYRNNAVFTAESPENYENIYQYDPLGWVTSLGYSSPVAWCANVFTAKSDETLKAVSFYTTDINCNYEIYIYKDPDSGPINEAGPILTQSGVSSTAGYHTVRLNSGVQLQAGQKFSVVLKLTNPYYYYPIAMEYPRPNYSSKAKSNASESFISSDGNTWVDLTTYYSNANMCIKAFTDSASGLPVASFSASPDSGNAPLKVQFTDKSTGSPTSWYWDFGEGNTSKDQNPVHTYYSAGNYTVNLTVSNVKGTDSQSATINVSSKPVLPVLPGCTLPPTDPNNDGLYEDINGNGRMDFKDVQIFYDDMEWITENGYTAYFDFNKNNRIDFTDIVMLYDMIQ